VKGRDERIIIDKAISPFSLGLLDDGTITFFMPEVKFESEKPLVNSKKMFQVFIDSTFIVQTIEVKYPYGKACVFNNGDVIELSNSKLQLFSSSGVLMLKDSLEANFILRNNFGVSIKNKHFIIVEKENVGVGLLMVSKNQQEYIQLFNAPYLRKWEQILIGERSVFLTEWDYKNRTGTLFEIDLNNYKKQEVYSSEQPIVMLGQFNDLIMIRFGNSNKMTGIKVLYMDSPK
jgi:hypothetical protein